MNELDSFKVRKRRVQEMEVTIVGIDLAKNIFQVCGVSAGGKTLFQRKLKREKLLEFICQQPKTAVVAMESSTGSHHWAREIQELGFEVRIIPAQFVKSFRKSGKNDFNDAEAICEAASRAHMRFVRVKSIEQQDVQALHRIRERIIRARTALSNEIRGLLSEYGIIAPQGYKKITVKISQLLGEGGDGALSQAFLAALSDMYTEMHDIEARLKSYDRRIENIFRQSPSCQRLEKIPGVGPVIATAIVAAVTDPHGFKSGRHLSAWLGLVPRQNSSGGKTVLGRITKRGDSYLRKQLIHGARSVVMRSKDKTDRRSLWIQKKLETRGFNRTIVALANKNARVIWKLLTTEEEFKLAS